MEITCTRCHQALEEGSTYCPMCGLPQLVYQAEAGAGAAQPDRRTEPVRDAASIAWKPAMSAAAKLAVPAGIIFAVSIVNESSFLGTLLLMAAAAVGVVAIYKRSQQPAWLTIGAGARIGLVTGILSAWTTAAISGLLLFGARYWFGYGKTIDDFWTSLVKGPMLTQWNASDADPAVVAQFVAWLLSPEGRAGFSLAAIFFTAAALLIFAVAGGALGARFLARPRQPEV
jgi:uncharacterized Zn finger protein (UPF0148 family)